MAEELQNELEQQEASQSNNEYMVEQYKKLQANSVSRERYEQLLTENKNLLRSIVEGQSTSTEGASEPAIPVKDLIKSLESGELNNLDYLKTSLEIRNRVLAETGVDQYCPKGTEEDIAAAEQVASFIQSLIDNSNGDSNLLTSEYQRRVIDNVSVRRKK